MTVILPNYVLKSSPAFEHLRSSPLAGHHGVNADVPPEIVGQFLRPSVQFPGPDGLEGIVVQQHDAARTIAFRGAQGADVNRVRPAVNGMGATVAGPVHLFGLNGLDDPRPLRVGLRVDDVDTAVGQAGNHQVTALQMGMSRRGAERRAAGVPVEMVQLVAHIGHFQRVDHLGIRGRVGVAVHHGHRIRFARTWVEDGDVGQTLLRSLHRQPRRRVKGGVGSPKRHLSGLLVRV